MKVVLGIIGVFLLIIIANNIISDKRNAKILAATGTLLKIFTTFISLSLIIFLFIILNRFISITVTFLIIISILIVILPFKIYLLCELSYSITYRKYIKMKKKYPNGPMLNYYQLELLKNELASECTELRERIFDENLLKENQEKFLSLDNLINNISINEWEEFLLKRNKISFAETYNKIVCKDIVERATMLGGFTLSEFILFYQERYAEYLKVELVDHNSNTIKQYTCENLPPDTEIRIKGNIYCNYYNLITSALGNTYEKLENGDIFYFMGKYVTKERIYNIIFKQCNEKIMFLNDIPEFKSFSGWEKVISKRVHDEVVKAQIIGDINKIAIFTLDEFVLYNQEKYHEYFNLKIIDHNSNIVESYSCDNIPEDIVVSLEGETYEAYKNKFLPLIESHIKSTNVITMANGEKLYSTGLPGIMTEEPIIINM